MFILASPLVLLLLPLPLIIYRFLKASKTAAQSENNAVIVPFYQQLNQLQSQSQRAQGLSYWRLLVLALIWLLLVIAAAKPQWLGEPQPVATNGRNLLLAVDISGSMEELDMEINGREAARIDATKKVVSEFIQRRKGDRIGLVLFGSNAYLQVPLTFDTDSVMQFLREAQLGFAGTNTAIGDAIGLSVKRLRDRDRNNDLGDNSNFNRTSENIIEDDKVIILLTDGENTVGEVEPLQAAELAAKINTKIYTIGIGSEEMLVRSFFGTRRINPSADLDEKTLVGIAEMTGGKYFRARDTQELDSIYQELDKLEPIEQEKEWLRPITSLFMWPLGGALLLSIFAVIGAYLPYLYLSLANTFSKTTPNPDSVVSSTISSTISSKTNKEGS